MQTNRATLYKPVKPRLVEKTPDHPIYLGIHYKGFRDAEYITAGQLPINLIEIKPQEFKGKDKLFYQRGERFHIHKRNFEHLVKQARILQVAMQFHFPDTFENTSLNPGIPEQHNLIISLFEATAQAIKDYEMLPNLTFHLPCLRWEDKIEIPESEHNIQQALENTNLLFKKLKREHASQGWPILLGVENQANPTKTTNNLGYLLEHFLVAMEDTASWINLMIDAGHRILSDLSLEEHLLPFASLHKKQVINFHFHENQGEQTDVYHGDQHKLPIGAKIHGYLNYLRRAVQERIPIILEVKTRLYNPIEVLVISTGIRSLLDKMEEERLALEAK